ncbi:DinB family protein [Herbiconiux moechotypicola]|uniref:DinB family protein n=1 Tax=Herbiconiux moechotypicola TaxID=637393 RepID=A0ABP5QIB4_9MICO|nr:DinB family protein [Herbiconiux moechotypicola]MCS5729971.1 DinB family protein [Herbiconiux moechotypicola]
MTSGGTSTGTLPDDDRPQAPERGGERESIEGFLDFQRASVVWKATGLSDADAAKQLLPSITTVSGLIRHLADVERSWMREDLAGEQGVPYRWSEEDPDGEFRVTADDSLAAIIADYEAACAESREVAARFHLDDRSAAQEGRFTLRWILLHLTEETARHLGHIDILRELLDGATGE